MALEDIAGYSLRRKLGSGSAGTVWLVRDRASGRNAVLKRVPTTAISHPEELREDLTILQRIDHPHLAHLQVVRETGTEWLLFSQYVVAGTLTALLSRRGPLTAGELVTLLSPLAEALDHLHRTGLAHGRVTPANIMFDADGRPVLTDAVLHIHERPTTPTDDLTALAAVAHQSGGDPTVFTPDLFATTDPHELLALTTPIPIDLAFTKGTGGDPTSSGSTSTTPPRPRPTTKPPTTDDPIERARVPLTPLPTTPSTAATPQPTPPQPPSPKPPRATTKRKRRKSFLPKVTRRTPTPINPLTRLTSGTSVSSGSQAAATPPGRPSRRRRRPWHRRNARWKRSMRPAHPAYGVLAAVGFGAVVVLILGLLTVGVLDNPAGTAAAADRTEPSQSPTPQRPTASKQPARVDTGEWTRTLQALDTQRAQAFWTLDLALLDTIYVPGSEPWTADRALLTTYRKHQIRVRGLKIRIDKTTVESQTQSTVVLRTVDHLTAGQAMDPTGTTTRLPPATPTTRRITLTKSHPRPTTTPWRIASITTA
ncbi:MULTISPECIES: protein kinase domain-containing protein [unclassified Kribbella]|uniref:protein kinase domain-containing protein n=1 Tax=unclassified Kribbella TaxID=2644121 RepID=UPI00301A61FC